MIAMIIPISTNTMIAPCSQIQVGDIGDSVAGARGSAYIRYLRHEPTKASDARAGGPSCAQPVLEHVYPEVLSKHAR